MNERELYEAAGKHIPTFDQNANDLLEEPGIMSPLQPTKFGPFGFFGKLLPGFATATDLRAFADELDRLNGLPQAYPVPRRAAFTAEVSN